MASLRHVFASCAILESRIFGVGASESDHRTRQPLRGASAPGVSLRRCKNGGIVGCVGPSSLPAVAARQRRRAGQGADAQVPGDAACRLAAESAQADFVTL